MGIRRKAMNKALGLGLLVVSTALWVYVNYHLFIMYSSRQLDVDSIFFLFFDLLYVGQLYYIIRHLRKG
jgi:uncharacterized membrane protein YesL